MKLLTLFICTFLVFIAIQVGYSQNLKVSENGRYLMKEDGSPFFYMGDTAWELFHPRGESFSIDKSVIDARYIKEIWFDPRYGISNHFHTGDTQGIQTYTPTTSGQGQDWILIIENARLDLPMPGFH